MAKDVVATTRGGQQGLILAVFGIGMGLGATVGWQTACALYRTEDARKKVRAQVGMYIGLYGGFGMAALMAISQLLRNPN
mmetsp:Transcript_52472/g.105342  ORF Transcript_52472/g.105342 Transcript_52472/m.105342 type:complete len:80 (-) Transcript_52472:82-321(-)|eukprot:CAMPEP_0113833124 /NCGR_PEP_ID=MMETSP0328-20130328/7739_1 /TAXON_ID=39455 /ORGANISM="Alexandrium minutum" /LENGTH=79 /DNA_ID=CAMNT_0000801371 /DNA_START=11 /DNA_END=250 /DNA_ORIENTATION=- /assembly_acc=CAM_ASM_000350